MQRAYNWAVEMGYLDSSPLRRIKKPSCGRREETVTPQQWQQIKNHYAEGDPFLDLLEFCWETGCRPQEARAIEVHHVHLDPLCVLFPPSEAKGKKRWRIIRMTPRAAQVIQRRMAERTKGVVFLNAQGRPWTAFATNCRFCRLKKHIGTKLFTYAWRHGFANRKLVEGHVSSPNLRADARNAGPG